MKKPKWERNLGEVLGIKTEKKTFTSSKGTQYETDVVPVLECIALGSPTERKDAEGVIKGYAYEVYIPAQDLGGFSITATNKLNIKMNRVIFTNVRGGALSSGGTGWFKADSVRLAEEK